MKTSKYDSNGYICKVEDGRLKEVSGLVLSKEWDKIEQYLKDKYDLKDGEYNVRRWQIL